MAKNTSENKSSGNPQSPCREVLKAFDIDFFEVKTAPPFGYLSPNGRRILYKHPSLRTSDELTEVEEELHHITFLERMPLLVRRNLARVLDFREYNRNQVIARKRRSSWNMYIIITGVVTMYEEKFLKRGRNQGRYKPIVVEELCHGMEFGCYELLHKLPRPMNYRCKTPVQILELHRDYFELLLREIILNREKEVQNILKTLSTLKEFEFSEDDINELLRYSRVGKYPPHKVIFGGTKDTPYYVNFIYLGVCAVEQEVHYVLEPKMGYDRFRPAEPGQRENARVFSRRLEICQLVQGHYFGIGEDLSERYIRTLDTVGTIMIPRHLLYEKRPKVFDKMKSELEKCFPSLQKILDSCHEVCRWETFKAKTANLLDEDRNLPKT